MPGLSPAGEGAPMFSDAERLMKVPACFRASLPDSRRIIEGPLEDKESALRDAQTDGWILVASHVSGRQTPAGPLADPRFRLEFLGKTSPLEA
jgi:hypothetical protein